MDMPQNQQPDPEPQDTQDSTATIEEALQQMEVLYKSRCVQAPAGSNVTIREIKKEA